MKLGSLCGWNAINAEAAAQRREEKRIRKEEFLRRKRRQELTDAGFTPPSSRDYSSDSCSVGSAR